MRKSFVGLLVLAFLVSFAPKADAALILAVDINGNPACASDNDSGCAFGITLSDTNPLIGIIELDPVTIGGVLVSGSFHSQDTNGGNLLSSSSLAIINTLATTALVQASIGATDYIGPTSYAQATGSGTWINSAGSTTTYTYYNDPTNTQGADFALDRPGIQFASFTDTSTGGPLDSFSFDSGQIPIIDPPQFSMTLGFDMILLGNDRLDSRGQAAFKDIAAVPEPMSMLLLGTGLVGGGYLRRRQKKA